jgi:hypothetical protein
MLLPPLVKVFFHSKLSPSVLTCAIAYPNIKSIHFDLILTSNGKPSLKSIHLFPMIFLSPKPISLPLTRCFLKTVSHLPLSISYLPHCHIIQEMSDLLRRVILGCIPGITVLLYVFVIQLFEICFLQNLALELEIGSQGMGGGGDKACKRRTSSRF